MSTRGARARLGDGGRRGRLTRALIAPTPNRQAGASNVKPTRTLSHNDPHITSSGKTLGVVALLELRGEAVEARPMPLVELDIRACEFGRELAPALLLDHPGAHAGLKQRERENHV